MENLPARVQEKISAAIALLRKEYYAKSEIGDIITTRDSSADEENFLTLGSKHYIPKDWFTREDIFYDSAIGQFAENLALSETKYLLSKIIDCANTQKAVAQENVNSFLEYYRQFLENNRVHVIFAPIDLYVKMHLEWPAAAPNEVKINLRTGNLRILGSKPRIIWSNRYIPFNHFILLDKTFGEWVSKPSFDERLQVSIFPSDKEDQMILQYLTKIKFDIINSQKIMIISRNP